MGVTTAIYVEKLKCLIYWLHLTLDYLRPTESLIPGNTPKDICSDYEAHVVRAGYPTTNSRERMKRIPRSILKTTGPCNPMKDYKYILEGWTKKARGTRLQARFYRNHLGLWTP